ncbi:MAG: hypothetical protein ACNS61_14080 [Candidatus Wenzhouxiangella sp. M2_3B_020]
MNGKLLLLRIPLEISENGVYTSYTLFGGHYVSASRRLIGELAA